MVGRHYLQLSATSFIPSMVVDAGHCPQWETEVAALWRDDCFAPVSGHRQAVSACPKKCQQATSRAWLDMKKVAN